MNIEQYIDELKDIFNSDNTNEDEIIDENYFEWEISDWNKLVNYSNGPKFSPIFTVGGYRWYFLYHICY